MNNYEMLFTPMKIGEVTIPNRIVMTAMGVDVSAPDGRVTPDTVAYYTARAKGGTGLIITEYCRVNESDGACATGQLSLSSTTLSKSFGSVFFAMSRRTSSISPSE